MDLVFLGTADFAVPCLKAVCRAGHRVVGVVTQPDRPSGRGKKINYNPVKKAALALELNILQPESIKKPAAVAEITALKPELLVVVAYGQLLPGELLGIAPLGCINVHASLLPKYRGGAPIHRAILAGETETGVTTMHVSESLDAGDIILQAKTKVDSASTVGELHDILAEKGAELLLKTINLLATGVAPRIAQDHNKASYAPLLTKTDEKINWGTSAFNIVNLIRGMDPWPGAFSFWKGKNLKIWNGEIVYLDGSQAQPGEIIAASQEGILVAAANDTAVLVKELQLQGKKRLSAKEFLNGNPMIAGEKLI
ncbi:MAG: methionyl-tRNA formyltransferase [Bacillota bacterium]